MRQVDQVHDAEDQGQPGRHQEQHDAELDAVQHLFDRVDHGCMAEWGALRIEVALPTFDWLGKRAMR